MGRTMKTYSLLLMCGILLTVGAACNLSTSAGKSIELTDTSQDLIPTATSVVTSQPTQEQALQEEPTKIPTAIPVINNPQIPPTAVLPDVLLPVVDPPGPPFAGECVARPSQAGTLVNMRRGADLGYEVFAQLKTYVQVIGVVNGWYFVPFDGGVEAYVSSTVTKLEGDCAFLFPTPIPDRDPNKCYLDIPLVAGIEVNYYSEPQPSGSQAQGKMATVRLEIEFEKANWYKVTNYQGLTGWIPSQMGSINGSCNNITKLGYDTPICLIVAFHNGNAYNTPFTGNNADRFATVAAGEALGAVAKTMSSWYGFDPGIAQAGNDGLDRLRWVYPNETHVFHTIGDCNSIPVVYDEDADWDYAISTAGDVPTEGCYIRSTAPAYTNFIYTGLENPEVMGVLNTYAPFVSFGDMGHVIQVVDGITGWVNRDRVEFVGDSCPTT